MSILRLSEVEKSLDLQQEQRRSCHSKPASESHLDLLREGTFADVTFIVGPSEEKIPCHQVFLKARSPVFEAMFNVRWNQNNKTEVLLEDVDPKIFKKFLEYVYAEILTVTVSEALELLQLAHKYDVQLLLTRCEELLEKELTLEVAIDVFQAARNYGKIALMDNVGDLMAKSLSKLQTLPSFARMDKPTLMYMLSRNDLKMKELDVFRLALQWANNQSGWPVEQSLEDILPLIRFPIMTPNEFTTAVVPTGLLSQATLLELFTYFGTDGEAKKSMASTLKFSTERRKWAESAVALYSRDFYECKIQRQRYLQLSECLQFNIEHVRGLSVFNRLSALLGSQPEKKKNIALNGISLYFPTNCPTPTDSGGEIAPIEKNEFGIVFKAKRSNDNTWKDLLNYRPLKGQRGKLMHVEFGDGVPMESGMLYCITAEEISTKRGTTGAEDYEVRDFGTIQRSVTANVGDSWVCVGNIENRKAKMEFSDIYSSPQLIYKLHLKEW